VLFQMPSKSQEGSLCVVALQKEKKLAHNLCTLAFNLRSNKVLTTYQWHGNLIYGNWKFPSLKIMLKTIFVYCFKLSTVTSMYKIPWFYPLLD